MVRNGGAQLARLTEEEPPDHWEPRDQPDDERAIPLLVTLELVATLICWRGTANVLILAALLLIAEDILGTDIALQLTHP